MYGQIEYPQNIGNSERTIEKDGSLIVAFANLLARLGFDITPERLNNVFTNKEVYSSNGELTWTSLAVYFNVGIDVVTEYNDRSIVRIEKYGQNVFALIDNPSANTVIDSIDGTSKLISELGEAKEFYAYKIYEPIPYPEVIIPITETVTTEDNTVFVVTTPINGYAFSSDAKDHKDEKGTIDPGVYHIFNQVNGMINVTKSEGQVGLWINPSDNVAIHSNAQVSQTPATTSVDKQESVDDTIVKVKVIPSDPNKWQKKYVPNPKKAMVEYVTEANVTVKDLAGINEDKFLPQESIVPVAGFFPGPDGKIYARTVKSVGDMTWYGVPKSLISLSDNEDSDINDAVDSIVNQDIKGQAVLKATAKTAGSISRFNPFSYVKKGNK